MPANGAHHPVLEGFSPAVREWFAASFPQPTQPQVEAWPHIRAGQHTLVCAPTGSGKTLTAFLSAIDGLVSRPDETKGVPDKGVPDKGVPDKGVPDKGVKVLYISPLRALAFDVEKNLRSPLMGIRLAAERLGLPFHEPSVAMRTGDTPARERAQLARRPADLLITTPESLYLMLTSEVRNTLATVHTVIIDEIHAMAPT
jgi:ATP-dependent Lhr-like helicase